MRIIRESVWKLQTVCGGCGVVLEVTECDLKVGLALVSKDDLVETECVVYVCCVCDCVNPVVGKRVDPLYPPYVPEEAKAREREEELVDLFER